MEKNVKVSICIPVYNTPVSFIRTCLESVLNQSYHSYEIIFVDDGSTTEAAAFLDDIKSLHDDVRVFHKSNGGVSSARNYAIDRAAGEYICFVDADDAMDENWIESSVKLAEQYNADIVFGQVIRCSRNNSLKVIKDASEVEVKLFSKEEMHTVQSMLLLNDIMQPMTGMAYLDLGPCGKLYKKSNIKNVRFPQHIKLGEDQVFNHAVIKNCRKCVITNQAAYYYYDNLESASHTYHPDAIHTFITVMSMIKENLYNSKETLNAFYYAVINNAIVGISIQFFNMKSPALNMVQRHRAIKEEVSNELIQDALKNIKLNWLKSKKVYLKVGLFRLGLFNLLFMIKKILKKKHM